MGFVLFCFVLFCDHLMEKYYPQKLIFTSPRMEQQWIRTQGVKMMREGFHAKEVADFFNR